MFERRIAAGEMEYNDKNGNVEANELQKSRYAGPVDFCIL